MVDLDALAALNLEERHEVRFRVNERKNWTYGKALGVNDDGSLLLVDGDGKLRSIVLERVEAATRGPRGGEKWTPLA